MHLLVRFSLPKLRYLFTLLLGVLIVEDLELSSSLPEIVLCEAEPLTQGHAFFSLVGHFQ